MSRLTNFTRVSTTGTLLALAACESNGKALGPSAPPGGEIFRSYVALGNSITAGFQAGGINDSTQRESYARLVAGQMNTPYRYPSVGKAGCTPPLGNLLDVLTNPALLFTCSAPSTPAAGPLNNVAVPGADSFDPTSPAMSTSNRLAGYILGAGATQVSRAKEADPSFLSI